MPSRKTRLWLAQQLDMKENQVYKWCWEASHKDRKGEEFQPLPISIHDLSAEQKFEVFVNKQMKLRYQDQVNIEGKDGEGNDLPQDLIMSSVKQFCMSIKDDADQLDQTTKLLVGLENEVMFDSEEAAKNIINETESTQMIINLILEEESP